LQPSYSFFICCTRGLRVIGYSDVRKSLPDRLEFFKAIPKVFGQLKEYKGFLGGKFVGGVLGDVYGFVSLWGPACDTAEKYLNSDASQLAKKAAMDFKKSGAHQKIMDAFYNHGHSRRIGAREDTGELDFGTWREVSTLMANSGRLIDYVYGKDGQLYSVEQSLDKSGSGFESKKFIWIDEKKHPTNYEVPGFPSEGCSTRLFRVPSMRVRLPNIYVRPETTDWMKGLTASLQEYDTNYSTNHTRESGIEDLQRFIDTINPKLSNAWTSFDNAAKRMLNRN
jgi:hypothetical protein